MQKVNEQNRHNYVKINIKNKNLTALSHVEGNNDACRVIKRQFNGGAEEAVSIRIRRYKSRPCEPSSQNP